MKPKKIIEGTPAGLLPTLPVESHAVGFIQRLRIAFRKAAARWRGNKCPNCTPEGFCAECQTVIYG
jgi:hypothetical protein